MEECLSVDQANETLVGSETCESPARRVVRVDTFDSRQVWIPADTGFSDTGSTMGLDECCYRVTFKTVEGVHCGVGRPLLVDGQAMTAAPCENDADTRWQAEGLRPSVTPLSPQARGLLAEYWTQMALAEHASVASFARFSLDLMAFGAPPELLSGAARAAADEVEHTTLCLALASAYRGSAVAPGPLTVPGTASASLEALVEATIREGCIGETLAAIQAAHQLKQATDPVVRHVLERIVVDESRHAELAWATVRWAIGVGGAAMAKHVQQVFHTALAQRPSPSPAVESNGQLARYGVLDAHPLRAALEHGVREVIQPAVSSLIA